MRHFFTSFTSFFPKPKRPLSTINISYHWLIFLTSFIITFWLNRSFFTRFDELALEAGFAYLTYLAKPLYMLVIMLCLELFVFAWNAKVILGLILALSAVCGYYMDSMGIGFTQDIIQSVFATHRAEAMDMINFGLVMYLLLFVLLPLCASVFVKLSKSSLKRAILLKLSLIIGLSLSIGGGFVAMGKDIIFVFKAQKSLAYLPNPIAPIRASIQYAKHLQLANLKPTYFALDATLLESTPPQILIFIIGESARSENFSLNGYERETNPFTKPLAQPLMQSPIQPPATLQSKAQSTQATHSAPAAPSLISFREFYSCGVITAISVPCMLTHFTREQYTHRELGSYTNTILQIAQNLGYEVWYLGNNSGGCVGGCDKDIAHTIYYPSDSLDGVMLPDMEKIISRAQNKRVLIVAHSYGSHGASYFERYPKEFEFFTPVCRDKELSKCDRQEIYNAYDNSLRYNDYFLSQSIALLQNAPVRSMLWYVSDHGESLGEMGQYMHGGLGYALAPKVQKHIPSIMWFSQGWGELPQRAWQRRDSELSHDFVFHTLLHLLGAQTKDYEQELDILG